MLYLQHESCLEVGLLIWRDKKGGGLRAWNEKRLKKEAPENTTAPPPPLRSVWGSAVQ